MIKVKKEWRKAEEEILNACKNLPSNIKLKTGSYGIYDRDGVWAPLPSKAVCPLGARLLGGSTALARYEVIGTTYNWVLGFWSAVDHPKSSPSGREDDWKAGYQAGKRIAKKVGLR